MLTHLCSSFIHIYLRSTFICFDFRIKGEPSEWLLPFLSLSTLPISLVCLSSKNSFPTQPRFTASTRKYNSAGTKYEYNNYITHECFGIYCFLSVCVCCVSACGARVHNNNDDVDHHHDEAWFTVVSIFFIVCLLVLLSINKIVRFYHFHCIHKIRFICNVHMPWYDVVVGCGRCMLTQYFHRCFKDFLMLWNKCTSFKLVRHANFHIVSHHIIESKILHWLSLWLSAELAPKNDQRNIFWMSIKIAICHMLFEPYRLGRIQFLRSLWIKNTLQTSNYCHCSKHFSFEAKPRNSKMLLHLQCNDQKTIACISILCEGSK